MHWDRAAWAQAARAKPTRPFPNRNGRRRLCRFILKGRGRSGQAAARRPGRRRRRARGGAAARTEKYTADEIEHLYLFATLAKFVDRKACN